MVDGRWGEEEGYEVRDVMWRGGGGGKSTVWVVQRLGVQLWDMIVLLPT